MGKRGFGHICYYLKLLFNNQYLNEIYYLKHFILYMISTKLNKINVVLKYYKYYMFRLNNALDWLLAIIL